MKDLALPVNQIKDISRRESKLIYSMKMTNAGQISISALGIILFNAGWLGYVVSCASFIHTVESDSKCLSLKRKTYDGIPKGYLAVKVVESAFTKANYKGKKKTVVQYGYNVPNV